MAMNVCALMGRLTADPELRQTGNGNSVVSFTVAVECCSVARNCGIH